MIKFNLALVENYENPNADKVLSIDLSQLGWTVNTQIIDVDFPYYEYGDSFIHPLKINEWPVVACQQYVSVDGIKNEIYGYPRVYLIDSKIWIQDGHHRLAKAWISKSVIDVKLSLAKWIK